MFYEVELRSYVRVAPSSFEEDTKDSVLKSLNEMFEGYISEDIGAVIAVSQVKQIGEGVIVPGDGAAYYDTTFKVYVYRPEMQELVVGKITDITDFGAFIEIGPIDGMIHIGQAMDDFVSFSRSGVLTGKDSKRTIKVGDICRARIIAVSYKESTNPKIGLTMRQPYLGNVNWIEEDIKKAEKSVEKESKKK